MRERWLLPPLTELHGWSKDGYVGSRPLAVSCENRRPFSTNKNPPEVEYATPRHSTSLLQWVIPMPILLLSSSTPLRGPSVSIVALRNWMIKYVSVQSSTDCRIPCSHIGFLLHFSILLLLTSPSSLIIWLTIPLQDFLYSLHSLNLVFETVAIFLYYLNITGSVIKQKRIHVTHILVVECLIATFLLW